MAFKFRAFRQVIAHSVAERRWDAYLVSLRKGDKLPNEETIREFAARMHRQTREVLQLSDRRFRRSRASLEAFPVEPGTDWRWRPNIFSGPAYPAGLVQPNSGSQLGQQVSIWHDCPDKSLQLRQIRNWRLEDLAPFGLQLEVFGFTGEYLSMSLELPETGVADLAKNHILRLQTELHAELPMEVFGRLNIVQGPNTTQLLRQLGDPIEAERCRRVAEFDIAAADLSDRSIERVWLDLIFASPYMNAVVLSDVVMSRFPRAEI